MSILYKNSNGDITSIIPDMNNIDDSTVAADTTYSSEKIEGTYPITTTSTTSPISTANGKPRAITIYGKSEVVDGAIKSAGEGYAVVDLGTLDWIKTTAYTNPIFIAPVSGKKVNDLNYMCAKYVTSNIITGTTTLNAMVDGEIGAGENNSNVYICDTNPAYTDATAFKSAMSGVLLCYQLADPSQGNTIAIKTDNGTGIDGTMATFSTGTPLYGVSADIRNVMEWEGSSGEVTKNCNKIRLADLTWTPYNTIYYATISNKINNQNNTGICPSYNVINSNVTSVSEAVRNLTDNNSLALSKNTSTPRVYIRSDGYSTVEDFVASLGDAELVYELATPTTEPLTIAENDSLSTLKTYAPQTTITINDNPEFEVEAYADTANGQAVQSLESNIKSQIDEVKNEKNHFCYSYKIDLSDSNPATCVKPHFDTRYGCDNFSYTSAKMNYTTGVFDYGSWEGFIRRIARPCMLKYDGTVDYYLDPDDYSKKITGEASDVADVNYQGNAMVELEKLYFKRYTYNGIQYCFISDRKLDKSFKCWAHHDKYGKELDYIYRACYDGMYDGTRLRSISGVDYHNLNALTAGYIMSNATRQEEMNFAKANNVSTEQGEGWNILHKAEWDYINDILILIGMSTDVQTTFGRGRDSGYVSTTNTGIISTGTMNDKGLFWGKNDGTAGVKVLGIENHWANLFKSCAGWFNDKGTQKVKYTYGTEDGSTGEGYNITADGYISITGAMPTKGDESTSGGGYITAWQYGDYGILPYETISGASNKYLCDYIWFNNTATCFALVGGYSHNGLGCGAFASHLGNGAGNRDWGIGAALSYKPLSAA